MKAVSLFSGVGGFEIGFGRAGIETVLQCESDPWCLSVLERHWPDVERVTDVRSVGGDKLRRCDPALGSHRRKPDRSNGFRNDSNAESGIDLVYGGFPCQDVSVAGNRAGLAGARSGLWSEFRRIVSELRPRWLCGENVPGLLSSAGGRDFGTILSDLDDLGYGVAWAVLDGRFFGVPQRRRRVFIVGCLGNPQRAAQVLAVCESCGGYSSTRSETGQDVAYSLAASVRGTGDGHGNAWNSNYVAASLTSGGHLGSNMPERHHEDDDNLVIGSGVDPECDRMDYESENFVVGSMQARDYKGVGNQYVAENKLVVAGAQRASDGHHGHSSPRGDGGDNLIAFHQIQEPITSAECGIALSGGSSGMGISNTTGVRRLTPLECERLMAWPDYWTKHTADGRQISDSHRYRMIGNGVIATVAEWLGHRLMRVDSFMERAA